MVTVLSTPYRENSILAIAKAVFSQSNASLFFTTLYLASWQGRALPVPLVGQRLANEFGRRAFPGIPVDRVLNMATLPELAHVATRRLLGNRNPALTADLMYRVKDKFDRAVSRRLKRCPPDALVGMYAAAAESFRIMRASGGISVLNFVNSHPAEHNRYLKELAGLKAPHHELIPDWVARRVEEELALADLILVPSRFVADQLQMHGVPPEKIATLPYGVDLRAFHPPEERKDQRGPRLECLYVGQISHRKGIRVLLEAARLCRDLPIRFRLIGPIVSADVLKGMPENAVYEGPSLPGGVAQAMRNADFFVLPTIEDSFALVLFEAMATALPVVTTSHAGASELIEDGHNGLIVQPGDSAGLADAIRRLVDQPELRKQLGNAARTKVQSAHSWESYGQTVLEAIEGRVALGRQTGSIEGMAL